MLALCPQTIPQLHKNLTTAPIRQTFESKGPPIVATNIDNKKNDEKCYL